MSSSPDAQGIALRSPEHDADIAAGHAFAYLGGRKHIKLVYFLGAETGGESKYPPPSLQDWRIRDMYGRRDNWTCGLCGNPIPQCWVKNDSFNLSIDHIVPKSLGGSNYPSNLRATHQACNKGRNNRPDTNFTLPHSLARAFA